MSSTLRAARPQPCGAPVETRRPPGERSAMRSGPGAGQVQWSLSRSPRHTSVPTELFTVATPLREETPTPARTRPCACRACGRRAPSAGSLAPRHLAGTHPPACPGVRHQPPRSTSVHGRERQVSVGFRQAMLPRIPHGVPHGHRVRCGVTGSGGGYTGPTALSCNFL